MSAHPSAEADVLVVGGGPAGAAAATRLAASGHRVIVIDRDSVARPKSCGELLTPRAVAALSAIGVDGDLLDRFHPIDRVRVTYERRTTSARWPAHDAYPRRGYVAPRAILDPALVDHATASGARFLTGHEANQPIVERGFVRGAVVTAPDATTFEVRAGYTIVADGANSTFGRALGTFRRGSWPYAAAHRATYASALHDVAEAEIVVDLRDRAGTPITGYGWMFPRGDGTVNSGVVLMSTSPSFQVINPAHLLDRFVADHADRWHLDPHPVLAPAGGRIPLGSSVGPSAGPTYLLVGDAAGVANPMSGAGIEYALETGVLAADVIDEALQAGSSSSLQRYPPALAERYGPYFKIGRLANRVMGRPSVARWVAERTASSDAVAEGFVRITANELRGRRPGMPELAYRLARAASPFAPDA